MSLSQASRDLDMDPKYVKGFAECMGIRLELVSTSLMMTKQNFDRLSRRIKSSKRSSGVGGRKRRPAQATVPS